MTGSIHSFKPSSLCASLVALVIVGCVASCSSTSTPSADTLDDGDVDGAAQDAADASSGDANDDADAPSCPLPGKLGSPLCERCLSRLCCDVIVACDSDPACHTVLACSQACLLKPNAGPCIEKCVQDTPAGATKYKAFDSCIAAPPPQGCAFDCS